ncbi:MAG: LTA synthase family protein [Bacteroidales bacterium]|nr:LTA synthase family protein [Bacteroidales bacterium]
MKKNPLYNIILIFAVYVFWITVCAVQKPVFLLCNHVDNIHPKDVTDVVLHGLKLDVCFAAYLTFIPILLLLIRTFVSYNLKKAFQIYTVITAVVITVIFSVDCVLYSYWGFRMDSTLIFYLKDFDESLNSVTAGDVIKFCLIALPYFAFIYFLNNFTVKKLLQTEVKPKLKADIPVLVLLIPLFIVFTRGGFSAATANIGMVYYSDNQKLNIAAINPAFSLVYSLTKQEDFANKYKFYDDQYCKNEFKKLLNHTDNETLQWLSTPRPNVLVIILESFSASVIKAFDGAYAYVDSMQVTPNLNRLASESVVFKNAFSNGMRTDRGIVSVLTGFPAQPDMSIIKYPEKTRSLPTMAKVLTSAGYHTSMLYGGDINFANMRSYFYSSMYKTVTDFKAFDIKYRMNKWGVNDAKTFEYLYSYLTSDTLKTPYFATFLTLSSHEPFDVPCNKFSDPYLNGVAYTDSCLGVFIDKLKTTPLWQNTLVVLVADHGYPYPQGMSDYDMRKYRIPVMFTGGVIKQPLVTDKFFNQTDIPKTVFTQMNLPCSEFIYSRDIFNHTYNNYAYYVFNNGFCFIDSTGYTMWDNNSMQVMSNPDSQRETKGKVLLQTIYKDIARR